MLTLLYPPSTKPDAAEHSLLRALGGGLTFLSILLALLGIIFHQRVPDLILASSVGIFALRVLILWLGAKPQHHQPISGRSSWERVRDPLQSPPSLWPPPPYASGPMPSPAPLPRPSQQENWQDDDGNTGTPQRGDDHGTT